MTDSAGTPRRLLLIDDDPACRTTFAYLLQRLGHMVEAVENGSAGIALLRQKPVDLVLTDLMMPGLTGWDVARLVKAMHPRLPVVLVTGCAHTISPDRPERQFIDAILEKPCGVAAMQEAIGALTRDLAQPVGSADPESAWPTKGSGRPMNSPVLGSGLDAPLGVHAIPMGGDARSSKGLAT